MSTIIFLFSVYFVPIHSFGVWVTLIFKIFFKSVNTLYDNLSRNYCLKWTRKESVSFTQFKILHQYILSRFIFFFFKELDVNSEIVREWPHLTGSTGSEKGATDFRGARLIPKTPINLFSPYSSECRSFTFLGRKQTIRRELWSLPPPFIFFFVIHNANFYTLRNIHHNFEN